MVGYNTGMLTFIPTPRISYSTNGSDWVELPDDTRIEFEYAKTPPIDLLFIGFGRTPEEAQMVAEAARERGSAEYRRSRDEGVGL